MKTTRLLTITIAASLAVGGIIALKARAQDAPRVGQGRFLARAAEKLGLSEEQRSQIRAELLAEKDTLKTELTAMHDSRVGLRETIQKRGVTEAEIRAAVAKSAAAEADLAVERAKLYGKISPILTAEQLAKVDKFQARVDDFVDGAILNLGQRLTK
jgi:Spy/CpxP family protein refolding chaperone